MKSIRLALGLTLSVVVIGAVRLRIRSNRVPKTPALATYLKVAYKPAVKWAANRILKGRYLGRAELEKGRFTQTDIDRILDKTWRNYDELAPTAHVELLQTQGNRQNKLLGVLTHGLYRALLDEGVVDEYATALTSDLIWLIYEKWIALPRSIARLLYRDPQKQMNVMLQMFLHYPFSPPGYDSKASAEKDVFTLDIHRCPVYDYFKTHGEEGFMLNSWCKTDFALAQVMTEGGSYQRPHTLTAGDKVCDMKWYGKQRN